MMPPDETRRAARGLFAGHAQWKFADSICRGLVPGRVFVDDAMRPRAAIAVLERFGIGCAAGDADRAPALLDALRDWHPWYALLDPPPAWHPLLAGWSPGSFAAVRYAFDAGPEGFDRARLAAMATPPDGTRLCRYDAALVAQSLAKAWSEDQTGAFLSADDFLARGLGWALVDAQGVLLAGCASFCRHRDGYEIQVDTDPAHRGKGYAACVCAAFLLDAVQQGARPHWDAANAISMRLALRLGYRLDRAYPACMLVSPGADAEAVRRSVIGD